jgi:hypothetical protein
MHTLQQSYNAGSVWFRRQCGCEADAGGSIPSKHSGTADGQIGILDSTPPYSMAVISM